MPITPNYSIYYRDTSTPASLETESALQADSVDDALVAGFGARQIQTYRWANAIARAAQAGMQAGDRGYQIDAALAYEYTGSAWVVSSPAMVPIVPTATGSGSSVSAGGVVTLTAASAVRLNGITGYDRYMVEVEVYGSVSNQAIYLQMANGSTVETGSVYGYTGSLLTANSASFSAWNAVAGGTIDCTRVITTSTAPSQIEAFITSLNAAKRTRFAVASGGNNGTALMQFDIHGEVATTTAYNGINVAIQSGNMTGTIRVYGMV